MRVIEASLDEDLSLFSAYLCQQRIQHRIYEESGAQVLELADGAQAGSVKAAYSAWRNGELILERRSGGDSGGADRLGFLLGLLRRYPATLSILALAVLVLGLWPAPVMEVMHASVDNLLQHVAQSKLP